MIAAGLVASYWRVLAVATVIYALGTVARVRAEETLLRERFGARFETYARKVPAIVPWLF